MAICAKNTVTRAKAIITATSVRIPERGTITSMRVGVCVVVEILNIPIFYHISICFVTAGTQEPSSIFHFECQSGLDLFLRNAILMWHLDCCSYRYVRSESMMSGVNLW